MTRLAWLILPLLACSHHREQPLPPVANAPVPIPAALALHAPAPSDRLVDLDVIWVSFAGVEQQNTPYHQAGTARPRELARAIATAAHARLAREPFAVVAATVSDDAFSRQSGGAMGMTPLDSIPPELATPLGELAIGEASPVIETPHGFYVLHRGADLANVRLSAASIFVTWTGADSLIGPAVRRTHDEAKALAESARRTAAADPAHFVDTVRRFTDDRERVLQDGWEGVWSSVASPLENFPQITSAVIALHVGDVSPVIETTQGFYVLRRLEAVEPPTFAASEILISYTGARFASAAVRPVTRTHAEARALAEHVAAELRAQPDGFAAKIAAVSDSPSSTSGGKRRWAKGRMQPAIDHAIERARVGAIVGPVETPLGFTILHREGA